MYINQVVTRQTRLQLEPAPPGPVGVAAAAAGAAKGTALVSECRRRRSGCRRWRGNGDGDASGVGMLTALLLPLLRQCCYSQAVSRQTLLQMVPAPPNPNRITPRPGSLRRRRPGRSSRTGPARLALTRYCRRRCRSGDGDSDGIGVRRSECSRCSRRRAESLHTPSDTLASCTLSSAVLLSLGQS